MLCGVVRLLAAATGAEAGECQQAQRGRRRLGRDLIADGAAREADIATALVFIGVFISLDGNCHGAVRLQGERACRVNAGLPEVIRYRGRSTSAESAFTYRDGEIDRAGSRLSQVTGIEGENRQIDAGENDGLITGVGQIERQGPRPTNSTRWGIILNIRVRRIIGCIDAVGTECPCSRDVDRGIQDGEHRIGCADSNAAHVVGGVKAEGGFGCKGSASREQGADKEQSLFHV